MRPSVTVASTGASIAVWDSLISANDRDIYGQIYTPDGRRVGAEFLVNSYAAGIQQEPAVAAAADGSFVVVWSSAAKDASTFGIYAQRFDAAGNALGSEFRANETAPGDQTQPAIAMLPGGRFIIAWQSQNQDDNGWGIYARSFDSSGSPLSGESLVNITTTGDQITPAVASNATGQAVVAWGGAQIAARRIDSDGQPTGPELIPGPRGGSLPGIGINAAGELVLAWGDGSLLSMQRFDSTDTPISSTAYAAAYNSAGVGPASLAMNAAGDYVVAWECNGVDGDQSAVYVRQFNIAGMLQGETRLNQYTKGAQSLPSVAVNDAGDLAAVWQSPGQDGGGWGVFGRLSAFYANPASIGGVVWDDSNADGIRQTGERLLDNVKVEILTPDGQRLASVNTSSGGQYRYDAVRPGEQFKLRFIAPTGMAFSPQHAGADDSTDSEADPTGVTSSLSLGPGETRLDIAAGLFSPGTIAGRICFDANGNGTRNAGEAGLGGWTAFADANANQQLDGAERFTTTKSDGSFAIDGLNPGSYSITVIAPPGWTVSGPRTGTITSAQILGIGDFAAVSSFPRRTVFGPIGGEFRVVGSTSADGAAAAIGPDGNSVVAWTTVDADGSGHNIYTRLYSPAELPISNEFRVNTIVSDEQTAAAVAIGADGSFIIAWQSQPVSGPNTCDIYTRRFDPSGKPLGAEFRVNGPGHSRNPVVAINPAGGFLIAWTGNFRSGDGDDGIFARRYSDDGTPLGEELNVNTYTRGNQNQPAVAFDASGSFVFVWTNADRDGEGILARCFDSAGSPQGTEFAVNQATNGNQNTPAVAMLDGGGFKVAWLESVVAGSTTLYARAFTGPAAPADAGVMLNTYAASGFLQPSLALDAAGQVSVGWSAPPIAGGSMSIYVQRCFSSGAPQTAALRASSSTGLSRPSVATDSFGNLLVAWTNLGICAQRYATAADPGSISGRVWEDLNGNGVQDPNEPGKAGVPVVLYSDSGAVAAGTVTDGDGLYRFDVPRGEGAYVQVEPPGGLIFSAQKAGADDATDSDVAPTTGRSAVFTLLSGQSDLRIDAGLCVPGSISGRVFLDANANGLQDAGEAGSNGVTVKLLNSAGDLVRSKTTSSGGLYTFSGIAPMQEYRVEFSALAGMVLTLANVGSDDAIDSDADPGSGRTAAIPVAVGQSWVHVDAGLAQAASVTGIVFYDANGSGTRDAAEIALPGFVVFADTNANGSLDPGEISGKTDVAGKYNLVGLRFGPTTITQVGQHMWRVSDPRSMTLTAGQNWTGIDLPDIALARNTVASPIGPLLTASVDTTSVKSDVVSAADANGNFVVVWTSSGQDGSERDIYARRFNASGEPQGSEFPVNITTAGTQSLPVVAIGPQGEFVIAWQRQDGSAEGIFAQRFNAAGERLGNEFLVNTWKTNNQSRPSVAMDPAGSWVIVWDSYGQGGPGYGIFAQRYNAAGEAQGAEFRVGAGNSPDSIDPAVAMDANGRFVIAWPDQRTSTVNIVAQQYDASGQLVGGAFQVNTSTTSRTLKPVVAMNGDGQFTIAWQTGTSGAFAQRYDAAGSPLGAEITIDSKGQNPAVAMDAEGGFIALWSNSGFRAQRYDASGLLEGQAFVVPGNYQSASIAIDGRGYFLIPGAADKVAQVQRYGTSDTPASVAGRVWDDLNGNGLQEAGENGKEGIKVELVAGDNVIADTTTANGGRYSFGGLIPGEPYALKLNTTLLPSPMNVGSDRSADSDFDPVTRRTQDIVLKPGENGLGIDAGVSSPAKVSGTIFNDVNGNGQKDLVDLGLEAWTVYLDIDGDRARDPGEPSTVTAANGSYSISNIRTGSYTLLLLPQDFWTWQPRSFSVLPGQTVSGVSMAIRTSIVSTASSPTGAEFSIQVQPETAQDKPAVAADAYGNYVVVWRMNQQTDPQTFDADGRVYVRRFDSLGTPQGDAVEVCASTPGRKGSPDVAMNLAGDFVVVWANQVPDLSTSIHGQRYDSAGQPQGSEFIIDALTITDITSPQVAMEADGAFVVVWENFETPGKYYDIMARRFDPQGSPLGAQFRANTYTVDNQISPAIAMDTDGDFVIVWQSLFQDGSYYGVYAQRYDASGVPQGPEFRANTTTANYQAAPDVAMAADGHFIVTWEVYSNASNDSFGYAQRYDAAGVPQGAEFCVAPGNDTQPPAVAADAAGNYIVAWQKSGSDPSQDGIFARRYSAAGLPLGAEFRANTFKGTDWTGGDVTVAAAPGGDFIVSWVSLYQDGAIRSDHARCYQLTSHPYPVLVGTPAADQLYLTRDDTDLLLYLNDKPGGTPASRLRLSSLAFITLNGLRGNDTLTVDFSNGNPVPSGGLIIDASNIDLSVKDTGRLALSARNSSTVNLPSGISLTGLTISDASRAALVGLGPKIMLTAALSIGPAASLDLADGGLIVQAIDDERDVVVAEISNCIKSARGTHGKWLGTGLTSSAAKADADHLTGLAVAVNDRGAGLGPLFSKFGGMDVDTYCVLVKYTWNGDANLDGVVNSDDYFMIDSNFIPQAKGYQNGDFSYDGVVNADDYFLIDSVFLGQSGPLAGGESVAATTHAATEPDDSATVGDLVIVQPARKQDVDSLLAELFSTQPVL